MTHSSLPLRRLTIGALTMMACGETTPTQPETTSTRGPAASAAVFASNSWTERAAMPGTFWRFDLAAGVANNAAGQSIVYVLGGRFSTQGEPNPATTVLAYNVATNTWTTKRATFAGAATNGIGKLGGRFYMSGGWDFTTGLDVSPKLFAYDWAADRLVRKADMPRATADGVTGVIGDKLYVLAGKCHNATCNDFYRYDPVTNAWTTLPPSPSNHWRGAGAVINGKFYVAGGGTNRGPFRSFDKYDPVTNTWQTLGLMPARRNPARGANLNGKFYVIGVESGSADRNTVAYTPTTNTWRNRAPWPGDWGPTLMTDPSATVRVMFEGLPRILAVGIGRTIYGTNDFRSAPSQMYTP